MTNADRGGRCRGLWIAVVGMWRLVSGVETSQS